MKPGVSTAPKTRQQTDLTQALNHIRVVESKEREVQTIYGGLCHKLPVLVRTCGLCQAVAFIEDKASKNDSRGQAYGLLRVHLAAVIDVGTGTLLSTIQNATLSDYVRYTRRILSAWIYYKRFAVAILKTSSAQAAENTP